MAVVFVVAMLLSYMLPEDADLLTHHLERRPGDACEVDWSGKTMRLVDQVTGKSDAPTGP
ncbi:MAG: hypothetical protein IJR68_10600 [Fretibacterium sp.]|nr:hypothetical protein [Fretibacterium sp.]